MKRTSLLLALVLSQAVSAAPLQEPRVYTEWEGFYQKDGLPSDKVFCVVTDGDKVWAGTDNGLALYQGGKWRAFGVKDGLAHRAVISLAVDRESHDLWIGTMGGLNRITAGRFETYNQFNSGLPNDVVFGVCVENQNVWVATTVGEGRLRIRENKWDVYTPANAPQHEPWGYGVDYNDGKVWAALWGGGALEFDVATEKWKNYLDPDGEMEIDLFRDDGIVHVITTGVCYREKILWVSTYFGMSSYDGHRWRGYMDHDTGLASNFVNNIRSRGKVAYACTDKGLSAVDYDSNRWVTYTPIHGPREGDKGWEARLFQEGKLLEKRPLKTGLANNFIWYCEFQGEDIWVATSRGLSHGIWRPQATAETASAQGKE